MIAVVLAAAATVVPVHVDTGPHLDGRLDDAAWASATAFTSFVQKDPDAGGPGSELTAVRFVYDGEALWVGIDCVQEKVPRVARLTRRDRSVDSDRVEVDLDSRHSGRDAFEFQVNAAGVLVDALRFDDTDTNTDWDENWDARVARTPTGWSAELRIPFRVLRYAREPGQAWGVQVRRFISARQETDELAPIPRGEGGETSRYGVLGPFDALPDTGGLELRPFALTSLARDPDGTFTPRASLGGDLTWHITPTLTLAATVNPDFAQVEADQVVLNLSTSETFYPEQRQFFLEGSDLFATPTQVLYTRRIGHVPDSPALPDGEEVRAAPAPARLWTAAKLTGTAGADTQIGAIAALTGAARVTSDDATGAKHDRIAEPWTAYAALRVRRGLGDHGSVGAFATAVGRFESHDYPMVGGELLCPDGSAVAAGARCTHDAVAGGLDARWRSSSGAYVIDGDLAASTIHGGPPRRQPDGIVIASGDTSPQGRLHAAKEDNGFIFDVTLEGDGRRFDINDAGFLDRANFVHTDWNAGWKDSTPGRFVRESTTQVEYFYWRNGRGERISGGYQVNTELQLANYWSMFTELHWRPAHFDDREVGDGTALQRAGQLGWELFVGSDPRRRVVASWSQSAYWRGPGINYSGDGDLTIHARPQLDIELLPSILIARGEPRYVATEPSGDRLFGRQDALAAGLTLRTTYTFTPRATLQIYGQLFGERVAYHDFSTASASDREVRIDDLVPTAPPAGQTGTSGAILNASAVFRWEWRLGSTVFVVYTRSQGADRAFAPLEPSPIPWAAGLRAAASQVFLIKLSYWWG